MNKDVAYVLNTESRCNIQGFFFSPWSIGCSVRGGAVGGGVVCCPERRRKYISLKAARGGKRIVYLEKAQLVREISNGP